MLIMASVCDILSLMAIPLSYYSTGVDVCMRELGTPPVSLTIGWVRLNALTPETSKL